MSDVDELMDKFHQNDYRLRFERLESVWFNRQYYREFTVLTFKYKRTITAVNVTWTPKIDLGDELSVITQVYKFASNEYPVFPIRMQLRFCDTVKKNLLGLQDAFLCGNFTGCPMLKNQTLIVCNWKPLIPSGSYMLELQGLLHETEMFVGRVYATTDRPIVIKKKLFRHWFNYCS